MTSIPMFLGLALGISNHAIAQTPPSIKELSKRVVKMPEIADCKARGICGLKNVTMVERKEKVLLANERAEFATYMTDFRFVVEVDKPSSIPNFGVVQFMRGCMFESKLAPDGTETRDFTYVHRHFGHWSIIKHDEWVIDSEHSDPLSTSFENHGRFDLYKWNKDASSLDADNATWYFNGKPTHGTVFKTDLIANAGLIEGASNPSARNASLELETCIFKIGDLPITSDEAGVGVDKSKAIWCAFWDHKFSYDFARGTIVQDQSIHAFCATPYNGPL